ncbi:MAG: hypothetical protein ACI4C7_04330 [Clostridia bacterium]
MGDLKDYRRKEIPMLVLGNILVLLYSLKVFDIAMINKDNVEWINLILTILNSTILSSVLYIFTIILDGIFSDKIKYRLVYLFLGKLPGETVFSDIKRNNKDIRFSYNDLKELHPEIYNNMPDNLSLRCEYENNEWYKLLKKHKAEDMVFQSHRESLMFRDMYCSNILFLVVYLSFSALFKVVEMNWNYVMFLLSLIILLNISARNKIKRFVYNVIASEISE